MRANIIMLAFTSSASPEIVAAVIPKTKMGAWYLSLSCRRYAKEDIAQPRARHAPSITVGDGSKMNVAWPGSKARICSPEFEVGLMRLSSLCRVYEAVIREQNETMSISQHVASAGGVQLLRRKASARSGGIGPVVLLEE